MARGIAVAQAFLDSPGTSIPQAMRGRNDTNLCCEFLNNDHVTPDALLRSHRLSALARVAEHDLILVAHDTTSANYTTHRATRGLGPIGELNRGLFLHSALAMSPTGVPLGLLGWQMYVRGEGSKGSTDAKLSKVPIEEKESVRAGWRSSARPRRDGRRARASST